MSRKDKKTFALICTLIFVPIILLLYFQIYPFRSKTVTIFSGLTILAYFYGLYKLIIPLNNINKELNSVLANVDNDSAFDVIASEINKTERLNKLFYEFKKTLRPIKSGIDEKENAGALKTNYYSTVDAENYFNESTLIINNIPYKTINFAPQVLTGLGIFGTFLGIVQGVSTLGNDMSSNQIQDAITKLLEGVDVSFTTSLYGISFSIAMTLITKIVFDFLLTKVSYLNCIIDRSLKKNTEKEGLKELEKELEKQTSAVERLATDISEDLGKKFDNSLQENMKLVSENINKLTLEIQNSFEGSVMNKIGPALEKLSVVSEELGKMQQTSTTKFITDTISRIEQVISAGTQNEIVKLKETMEIMSDKNNEFIQKFVDGMGNIEKLFESQKKLIVHTNDSAQSVNMTTQNISELQQGLSALLKDINSLHKGNTQSIEDINEIFNKLKSMSFEQNNITLELSEMINKTHEYSKMQENYMNRLLDSSNTIDRSIKDSKAYITQIAENIKQYTENFVTIKNTSLEIAEKLNYNYSDVINKLTQSSNILNNSISKVDDEIITNVSNMGKEMFNISGQLRQFCNEMNDLSNKFQLFANVESSTQKIWSDYKESFDILNSRINEGIVQYTEKVKEETNTVFEHYDTKVAEAVSHLKSMVESLSEELENIGDIFGEINDKIKVAS